MATHTVTTQPELDASLEAAVPGDTIVLSGDLCRLTGRRIVPPGCTEADLLSDAELAALHDDSAPSEAWSRNVLVRPRPKSEGA